jgi:membrane-associated PAP2 superfamily phosphatase
MVSGLKAVTNVACPAQLTLFGGSTPHVSLFSHYPEGQRPANQQRCFPAGHASGGFAVLSLLLLFKSRRHQRQIIVIGLLLGWVMGLYKMLIGDHFLSHTLTSMLIAWCSIGVVSFLPLRGKANTPD